MSTGLVNFSGYDFQWSDWFGKQSESGLLYAFPPNSVGDGFWLRWDKILVSTIEVCWIYGCLPLAYSISIRIPGIRR